ncbi:hypothetical protein D3C73_770250 [compost metagenome]
MFTDPKLIKTDAVGMDGTRDVLIVHLVIVPALVMKWLHEHGEFHVVLLLFSVTGALRNCFRCTPFS